MGSGTDYKLAFKSTANNSATNIADTSGTPSLTSSPAAAAGSTGGGGSGVNQIVAGSNISVSPITGIGIVTVSSTASSGYLDEFNVNAATYGAAPGASASANVTAINAAIAALNSAGGGRLLFPGYGTYSINALLTTITVPCEIVGMGFYTTIIAQTAGNTGIFILTGGPQWVHGLQFNGPGSSSSNYAIQVGTSGAANSDTIIESCAFTGGFYSGIQMVQAINSTRVQGNIMGGQTYAIEVGPLSGTPMIVNNTLSGNTAAVHINKCLGGGYIIEGNYFDGGQYSILYETPSAADLDMYIVGNHIEDYSVCAIKFDAPSSTGQMANIVIVGNEFANNGGTSGPTISIAAGTPGGVWIQRMIVTGNAFVDSAGQHSLSIYNAEFCTITGNCFGLNGATAGVLIDSSCNNVICDPTSNSFGFGSVFVTDNQSHTVANLQSASAFPGMRTFVTDATATTFMSIVAGTGGNTVPVFSNGTNWLIG